jgi:ribosomal protein S3
MGQKVNPISNRLGVIRGWDSNWYGGKKYGDTILEDSKIRKYLNVRLAKSSVSRIVIERTLKLITITVCTSRPGLIIGKGGSEVDRPKLLEAMYYVIKNEKISAKKVLDYVCLSCEKALKEEFVDASVAIKLAMNFHDLV